MYSSIVLVLQKCAAAIKSDDIGFISLNPERWYNLRRRLGVQKHRLRYLTLKNRLVSGNIASARQAKQKSEWKGFNHKSSNANDILKPCLLLRRIAAE
jgi:hypothetical protein